MMPFSTNDEGIDFVYGVINWKEVASSALTADIQHAMAELAMELDAAPAPAKSMPIWADGPSRGDFGGDEEGADPLFEDMLELTDVMMQPPMEPSTPRTDAADNYCADELCETLAEAQGAAADAITSEGRTRQALYRAIGLAHSFALAALALPDDYAALLEDAGIKAPPRSPMTALVKLIFGSHYDKTRLSEFAAAIDHGVTEGLAPGTLTDRLSRYDGGLKAYVRDARAARRGPAPERPGRIVQARSALSQARTIAMDDIATDADGLAVIVVRRLADGSLAPLGGLRGDDKRAGQVLQAVALVA